MSTSELADRMRHALALQEAGQAREAEVEYRAVLDGHATTTRTRSWRGRTWRC